MKSKILILAVLVCIVVAGVVVPKFRKSPLLDVSSEGMAMFDGGTRIYLHSKEKLAQLPIVFVRTRPPIGSEPQVFDVSIYRDENDAPKDGEILVCEEEGIDRDFVAHKKGTTFHFFIDHSTIEGDKYDFIVNGKSYGAILIGAKVIDNKPKNTDENDADVSGDEPS